MIDVGNGLESVFEMKFDVGLIEFKSNGICGIRK